MLARALLVCCTYIIINNDFYQQQFLAAPVLIPGAQPWPSDLGAPGGQLDPRVGDGGPSNRRCIRSGWCMDLLILILILSLIFVQLDECSN